MTIDFQRFVGLVDRDLAGGLGHLRQALRFTRLEELDDARQALGDVLARDTTGVEGAHGQLGAGLADRLGGDDPDRVADVDREAGRRGDAVAGAANAGFGLALERRADRDLDLLVAERLGDRFDVGQGDLLVALEQLATAFGLELFRRQAPDEVVVERAVVLAQDHLDVVFGFAVLLAHDHVLGDVDQTPRQVAGVGRAQRRVGEALSGTVGGDEVLQDREALHEVGLDRPLDDLAFRVGHQTAHPRQLADLFERSASARVGHHEDGVELVEVVLHRLRDLVGGPVPVRRDRLVALLGRDVAVVVLAAIASVSFS